MQRGITTFDRMTERTLWVGDDEQNAGTRTALRLSSRRGYLARHASLIDTRRAFRRLLNARFGPMDLLRLP